MVSWKLTTASVPSTLEPLFLKAEDAASRYFDERRFDPTKGIIEVSGERYALIRTASITTFLSDLIDRRLKGGVQTISADYLHEILYDLAFSIGTADAIAYSKKMNIIDPLDRLAAGPIHFSFIGWAYVKILPDSNPVTDESFFLAYEHEYSFESSAWRSENKTSDDAVCVMNSGYAAGWCSECFSMPLISVEVFCGARGDTKDRFIMAHPSKILDRLHEFGEQHGKEEHGVSPLPEFLRRRIENINGGELEAQFDYSGDGAGRIRDEQKSLLHKIAQLNVENERLLKIIDDLKKELPH